MRDHGTVPPPRPPPPVRRPCPAALRRVVSYCPKSSWRSAELLGKPRPPLPLPRKDKQQVRQKSKSSKHIPVGRVTSLDARFARQLHRVLSSPANLSTIATVEGKHLLKQRNALQRVSGVSTSDPMHPLALSSPGTPDGSSPMESPTLSRSAGRKSFKASLFRMIGTGRSAMLEEPGDDQIKRASSSPAVNSLAVSNGARERSPSPSERDTKKKEKKEKEKEKKEEKEKKRKAKKEKEKEKKSSFPLWAQSGKKANSMDPSAIILSPPDAVDAGGRPKSHSMLETYSVEGEYTEIPPSVGVKPKAATPPPSLRVGTPPNASTMRRMQGESQMGLGIGEKPVPKPKPSLEGQRSNTAKPPKPAKPPKTSVIRSKSARATTSHRIDDSLPPLNSNFSRPLLVRQDVTSSSESDPSRESTPSPNALQSFPNLGASCKSSDSGSSETTARESVSTTAESTCAVELCADEQDRLGAFPESEGQTCQVSPMLYQTWQVVSTTPDTDRESQAEPPGSPIRPPKARKPTLGEEQLRRMHTSIRRSARRHNKKNMRWDEQPKVRNSLAIPEMTKEEKQLQQRYFEVVSSERSYNQSMKVLVSHFMESEALSNASGSTRIISPQTHHSLFSNARVLLDVSNRFLEDLESRLQENVVISTVCDIIKQHVECHFDPFVVYCSNQAYQIKTLEDLLKSDPEARKGISELERAKEAQRLPMVSFLLLPMQRVTRLKLLVDGMLSLVPVGSGTYALTKETLDTLKTCVDRCNEGAKAMKRTEELIEINNQVDFGKLKPLALVSHKASRWLLRSGPVTLINTEKKNKTSEVHLIAFNDLLLLAKGAKRRPIYRVFDYCYAPFLEVDQFASLNDFAPAPGKIHRSSSDSALFKFAVHSSNSVPDGNAQLPENRCIKLTLLENSSRQKKEYLIEVPSITEKTRWTEALSPNEEDDSEERIYEAWDCPEVVALHQYIAQQPDELSMEPGDWIRVLKKMRDGWYQGQSVRTNEQGWFPESYVKERETEHSRARSLRQQHRLAIQTERSSQQANHGSLRDSPEYATADD